MKNKTILTPLRGATRTIVLIMAVLLPFLGHGQKDSTYYADIASIVYLDSFVVTAKRMGFNIEEFIELVQEDESFYKAFQNLRLVSYQAENQMNFVNKRGKALADYESQTRQESDGRCRTMEVLEENVTGNFYKKKKKYRYYTARMFDQVFFTHGRVCVEAGGGAPQNLKGIRKHVSELKKLIFQPGEEVDVPIIGGRTAIFSKKMAPYYDYKISAVLYKGNRDCYVFTARVKPEYLQKKEGKTIIKYLETYFEKESFQVVARKYALQYSGIFSFDVEMEIQLLQRNKRYFPEYIQYKGFWNVPGKRAEKATFSSRFSHFQ